MEHDFLGDREVPADAVDITYAVALGSRTSFQASHSRPDNPDNPWVVEHWHGDGLVVEFPGRASFELDREHVTLVADEADDPDLVIHLFLDHVLPRVVALRGDLMLHAAGAVGPRGRAHVFVGLGGTGKSTLATALAAAGWALLDDDGIRVVDGLKAVPGYAEVRLLPDAVEALVPSLMPGRPMAAGLAKRRFRVDGGCLRMAGRPTAIAAVYLLEPSEVAEPSVRRIGFGEATGMLAEHGFHLADEPEAISRQAFERASALAAAVPVWRLSYPPGLDRLGQTRALLVSLDAELAR
jgi:hypothetical protein